MRKPRLLIVVRDRFPLFRADLSELFGRWLTLLFAIDWVAAHERPSKAKDVLGGPDERFLLSCQGRLPWLWLQGRQGLRVARGDVDLVQVRDAAFSAAFFLLMARIGRRPFVYWMSYPMAEGYLHRARSSRGPAASPLRFVRLIYGLAATRLLYRVVLPCADHVFVQSERMKADVEAKGVCAEIITAVPMGVSVAAFYPSLIEPIDDCRLTGRKALIYVGAVDPDRNITTLVEALALVVRAGLDAVLVIIGGGDMAALTAAAVKLGVNDRLLFTGHLPLSVVLQYVRRADICLAPFPTSPETYLSATPTKLVEYLAMGRPVVAGDHPDQRRVIVESCAGVIAPATAVGFAEATIALLEDPVSAAVMGANGPDWVAANRDYAMLSQGVARVYDRLLKQCGL